jgi:diaminopimelate decarboxylase
MFNVESEAELDAVAAVATPISTVAPIALRVNPDVHSKTHRYISTGKKESKFGMDVEQAKIVAKSAASMPSIRMIGIYMHIGSQIASIDPYASAVAKGVNLIHQLRELGHPIKWYSIGGGYGINYRGSEAQSIEEIARAIVPGIKAAHSRLAIELGRVIVGNAGILVSRVLYTKQSRQKRFLIQDAAMNDLIRPALYESFHRIWPVTVATGVPPIPENGDPPVIGTETWDVVGSVCESGDFLAKDCSLPPVDRGAFIATFSTGGVPHGHGL